MTLTYTIQKQLTEQALVERDTATLDAFGGEAKAKREIVGEPIPCRFWWWREGGARSPAREYATPQRTIEFTGGGILVPKGSDIREEDHIAEIQNREGETLVQGPLRVVAVEEWAEHTECALMRP